MKPRLIPFAVAAVLALAPSLRTRAEAEASASSPTHVYAIRGAKVVTLAGPPVENGTVVIRDGKIAAVGARVDVPADAQVIDGKGLEVYPGLFDAITDLGLTEVEAVNATVDTTDVGTYNPQLVAMTAVHPASELIPVARANGITHALAAPLSGGGFGGGGAVISGQASAIHLAGWTIEDMLIRRSVAMVVSWPTMQTRTFDFSTFSVRERPYTEVKQEYDKRINELEDLIGRARHYAQVMDKGSVANYDRDLKLEALAPVVRGQLPLLVMAEGKREIRSAVEFCDKQKLKMILAGGSESYKVKDLLAAKHIPVILGRTQELPEDEDASYDQSYVTPSQLAAAGIKIAFASFNASFARRLPYQAANCVPYGLPYEEALKAVTLYPAQILGLADQLGTIEPGKMADVIVTDGDPLAIPTQVRYLFINGELTSTDNKHLRLYEKYRRRP
ncbi:MAG TPA: amidohydrolase family protein [Terriglobia bacterium]|nr:amidohydrolase family protein [Terriglobia bacterium]